MWRQQLSNSQQIITNTNVILFPMCKAIPIYAMKAYKGVDI
jgi:hypothetical protein